MKVRHVQEKNLLLKDKVQVDFHAQDVFLTCGKEARTLLCNSLERWLSGRKHVPAKDAYPKGYRGFESLSFRIKP